MIMQKKNYCIFVFCTPRCTSRPSIIIIPLRIRANGCLIVRERKKKKNETTRRETRGNFNGNMIDDYTSLDREQVRFIAFRYHNERHISGRNLPQNFSRGSRIKKSRNIHLPAKKSKLWQSPRVRVRNCAIKRHTVVRPNERGKALVANYTGRELIIRSL